MSEYDVSYLAGEDTKLQKKSRNEYAGPCPRCGGTDRFIVRLNKIYDKETDSYRAGCMCRNCWNPNNPPIRPDRPRWADEIDYLRWFKQPEMSYSDARAYLETLRDGVDQAIARVDKTLAQQIAPASPDSVPSELWQERNNVHVERAIKTLWSGSGEPVLEYLKARGLTEQTIKAAQLGALHSSYLKANYLANVTIDTWFVVLPWYADRKNHNDGTFKRELWCVNLRDIRPDCPKPERYRNFPGSGNGLYLQDCLKRKKPTFIVEGEFDALILAQQCGDIINVVATGSTEKGQTSRNAMILVRQPACILAQNDDSAGNAAASWWMHVLQHAECTVRFRPLLKDINEMYLMRPTVVRSWVESITEWLESDEEDQDGEDSTGEQLAPAAVETAADLETSRTSLQPGDQDQPDQPDQDGETRAEQPLKCTVCGEDARTSEKEFFFSPDGEPFCSPECQRTVHFIAQVAAIFGPGTKIERVPVDYTFQDFCDEQGLQPINNQQYRPFTLPALPRRTCPALVVTEKNIRVAGTKQVYTALKHARCTGKPLAHGWCEEHSRAAILLDLGAKLGYPEVDIPVYGAQGELITTRTILAGVQNWEAYGEKVTRKHLAHDLPAIKRLLDQQAIPVQN